VANAFGVSQTEPLLPPREPGHKKHKTQNHFSGFVVLVLLVALLI